ncbi:MAG: rane protein [Actinomycetia bacterium]|nr:rane protein [Actinomycetes bacterium]
MTVRTRRDPLPPALIALTVMSGFIDAVSYLGLGHVFTANMTGNIVILGFAAAGAPGFSTVASLTSLAAFLTGAVIAGRLNTALPSQRARVLTGLAAEAVLLSIATVATGGVSVSDAGGRYLGIALLALAMGLRNATVRGLAIPDMTTTVLTSILTGLAADSSLAGGTNPRVVRRVASVLSMLLGAYLGALLLRHTGISWPLLVTAACVTVIAAGYVIHPGSRQASTAANAAPPHDEK